MNKEKKKIKFLKEMKKKTKQSKVLFSYKEEGWKEMEEAMACWFPKLPIIWKLEMKLRKKQEKLKKRFFEQQLKLEMNFWKQ